MKRTTAAPFPMLLPGPFQSVQTKVSSPEDISRRAIQRRAVEAVIWGMPAVNAELMFQAMRDAKADFNQVVYWSRPVNWKNQTLTPNPDTIYLMPFFNTKEAGPMVLEIPPAEGDNSITGSIDESWQTAIEDVGPAGVDKGKGGKYLILPPDFRGIVPSGYIPMLSSTYAGFALLRSNLKTAGDADIAKAVAYGKRVRFYPLSHALPAGRQATNPPDTKFIDALDVMFDSTIPYDPRFFQYLCRFVQREPWQTRDKAMIDSLKTIGIAKGMPFHPDTHMRIILGAAAREAQAWLDRKFEAIFARPFNTGARWTLPATPDAAEGLMSNFASPNLYAVDDRGVAYSMAFFCAKRLGEGQYYLMTIADKNGHALDGSKTYCLTVPANAPVKLYWSATAYDRLTHALIRHTRWPGRGSNTPGLQKKANGSIDLFFGPKAVASGGEFNWIPTSPHGKFEVFFRFYGPEKSLFDKKWRLPDIEKVP